MAKASTSSKTRGQTKRRTQQGGDIIRIQNVGNSTAVAAGRKSSATVTNTSTAPLVGWIDVVKEEIDSLQGVSPAEKDDLKEQVDKIDKEARKGSKAEIGRLEKLINTLSVLAPDIFDVVIATLASPLTGGWYSERLAAKQK
jgi:hypothetical protein